MATVWKSCNRIFAGKQAASLTTAALEATLVRNKPLLTRTPAQCKPSSRLTGKTMQTHLRRFIAICNKTLLLPGPIYEHGKGTESAPGTFGVSDYGITLGSNSSGHIVIRYALKPLKSIALSTVDKTICLA
jgi:hypothetical protein